MSGEFGTKEPTPEGQLSDRVNRIMEIDSFLSTPRLTHKKIVDLTEEKYRLFAAASDQELKFLAKLEHQTSVRPLSYKEALENTGLSAIFAKGRLKPRPKEKAMMKINRLL